MPAMIKHSLKRIEIIIDKCGMGTAQDEEAKRLADAKAEAERQALEGMSPFERIQYKTANLLKETREAIKELDDITHQGLPPSSSSSEEKDNNDKPPPNVNMKKLQLSQFIRKSLRELKEMTKNALQLAKKEGGDRRKQEYESLLNQYRKTEALYKERFSHSIDGKTQHLLSQTGAMQFGGMMPTEEEQAREDYYGKSAYNNPNAASHLSQMPASWGMGGGGGNEDGGEAIQSNNYNNNYNNNNNLYGGGGGGNLAAMMGGGGGHGGEGYPPPVGYQEGIEMTDMGGVLSLNSSPHQQTSGSGQDGYGGYGGGSNSYNQQQPVSRKKQYQFNEYIENGGNNMAQPFLGGGGAGMGGGAGAGAHLPPLQNPREDEEFQQFFAQTRLNDEKIDEALDRIYQGVVGLKQSAYLIRDELKEQDEALAVMDVRVEEQTEQLRSVNKRLKATVKKVENDKMCCYLVCFIIVLACAGLAYRQLK